MVTVTLRTGTNEDNTLRQAIRVAGSVADPELPFLTVGDLGILREVKLLDGIVIARVTPTYTGCPAVTVIENAVQTALTEAGFTARVERVLSPPWSTDFITTEGRKKLLANGIAPPEKSSNLVTDGNQSMFFAERIVACPHCQCENTEKLSEFGSTPCKAQYRCRDCQEPFDHFKCH